MASFQSSKLSICSGCGVFPLSLLMCHLRLCFFDPSDTEVELENLRCFLVLAFMEALRGIFPGVSRQDAEPAGVIVDEAAQVINVPIHHYPQVVDRVMAADLVPSQD